MDRLCFELVARMRVGGPMWLEVSDGRQGDEAWGTGHLWGWLPMLRREGPVVRKSQVIRNLGEPARVPQTVLANPGLALRETGSDSFEAGHVGHAVRHEIDAAGDLVRVSAPDRPRELDEGEFTEGPGWIEYSDHAVKNGIRIPRQAVAGFGLAGGPWRYLRMQVRTMDLSRGPEPSPSEP